MSKTISIRLSILTIFFITVGIVAMTLVGLQYYFSNKLARKAAHSIFTQTAQKIAMHIKAQDENIATILEASLYNGMVGITPQADVQHPALQLFVDILTRRPRLYAIYTGLDNGAYYEVINLHSHSGLMQHFNAPSKSRWLVIKVYTDSHGKRIENSEFLDVSLQQLAKNIKPTTYDPTSRMWYANAIGWSDVTRSEPYFFSNLQAPGISYAIRLPQGNGVLGVDITLEHFDAFLAEQSMDEQSEIFLYGKNGKKISSSHRKKESRLSTDASSSSSLQKRQQMQDKWPDPAYPGMEISENDTTPETFIAAARNNQSGMLYFTYKNTTYFGYTDRINSTLGASNRLGMMIPLDTMLKPYLDKVYIALGVSSIMILLSIPLILYNTSLITQPIRRLMAENGKVRERRYGEVHSIRTHIKELHELSDSLVSMTHSIQAYEKEQQKLMDALVRLIADAIDAKSPYTGEHCKRVPKIAVMLARAAENADSGPFKEFGFAHADEWREFKIGAWLHDCGKVTTPEYVVDKATKLETIYNRIHEVRTRFEVLWRDAEISYHKRLAGGEDRAILQAWLETERHRLLDDFAFIAQCNIGGESMRQNDLDRLYEIADRTWTRHFDDRLGISEDERHRHGDPESPVLPVEEKLLSDKAEHIIRRINFDYEGYKAQGFKPEVPEHLYNYGELYNLCIEHGTLTPEERFKINEHVIMTIRMLEQLPLPEGMKRIPEYAGTHHETLTGTGYPRQLTRDDLSVPARIMAIADVFEALTATDRPYKLGKTLSEALTIMGFMRNDQHIDADLFKLFLTSGVYLEYAKAFLLPEQIDDVLIDDYLE